MQCTAQRHLICIDDDDDEEEERNMRAHTSVLEKKAQCGECENGTVHGYVDDGEDGVDQDDEDDDGLPRQRVQYDPQPPTRPATRGRG
jgi:hypothetical protein